MFSNCMFEHRLNESSSTRFFFGCNSALKAVGPQVLLYTSLPFAYKCRPCSYSLMMLVCLFKCVSIWMFGRQHSIHATCACCLHKAGITAVDEQNNPFLLPPCVAHSIFIFTFSVFFFITFLPFLLSSVAHCLPFLSSFLPLCHLPRLSFSVHTSLIIYTFPLLPSALLSPSIPCFASIPASLPSSLFPSPSCSPRLVLPSSLALHLPLLFSFPPLFLPLPIPLVPSPLFPLPPSRLCFFSSHHSLWLALNPTAQSFFLMCVCCLPLIQHRWVET